MIILRRLVVSFFGIAALPINVRAHVLFQESPQVPVSVEASRDIQNACKLPPPLGSLPQMLGVGISTTSSFVHSVGTVRTGMFFVDFPDARATESPQALLDGFLPDSARWYNRSSYGKLRLRVVADISRFYRMPSPSNSYGWTRSLTAQMQLRYITDAIMEVGRTTSFENLDVLYIVPTRAAKDIWFSPTYLGAVKMPNGHVASNIVTFGQDVWNRWSYKVLNHETLHTMGLPDLYPLDNIGLPTTFWVGGWDIMGLITGTAPDLFAWHKWKLSWIDDNQVRCIADPGISRHLITPLEKPGGVKMVTVRLNGTAALAIELRTKRGLDRESCSEGLLFYTINTAVPSGSGPIRVIDTKGIGGRGCDPARGGPLTNAAFNYADYKRDIEIPRYRVRVRIEGLQEDSYWITVQYDGELRAWTP